MLSCLDPEPFNFTLGLCPSLKIQIAPRLRIIVRLKEIIHMAQSKPLKMFVPPSACSVINLCLTFCNPMDCSPPGFFIHGISDNNTRVGCHLPSPGDLLTQGLNPHLLYWQVDSLPLSHQGSPLFLQETEINRLSRIISV